MKYLNLPVWCHAYALAWTFLFAIGIAGCDQAIDLALNSDGDYEEYVAPPLPPITNTPISQRAGIDFPQNDMGETFAVAFIEWDADNLAEVLVEEHGGKLQSQHPTLRAAYEAGGEQHEWGTSFDHRSHALLLQFRDQPYTVWLFSGPHTDKLKKLSTEAEVWVYAFDYDFSSTEWIIAFADGKEAGSLGMGELGGVKGDIADRVTPEHLADFRRAVELDDQAWDALDRDDDESMRLWTESEELWQQTISDIFASRDVYLPMFYGDAEDGSDWLIPRTAGGDADVRTVRLVKF